RLAANAITEMTEDCRPDRPCQEADSVDRKGLKRADQRIRFGEVQLGEHESRHHAVQKEVVPLDGSAYGGGDDSASELNSVFQLGKTGDVARDHVRCPLFSVVGPYPYRRKLKPALVRLETRRPGLARVLAAPCGRDRSPRARP